MNIACQRRSLAVTLLFALILTVAGCGGAAADTTQDPEDAVREVVRAYYTDRINGDYEQAASYLLFSKQTEDMKDAFPGCFETDLIQSFSINEVTKLTDELYRVNVVGLYFLPWEWVYDEDGNMVGTDCSGGHDWYLNCLDVDNYVAYSDGKWGFCISARYVPEGMYDFSEEELQGGNSIGSVDDSE